MKLDNLGLLVRERYDEGHPANYGESCAETSRFALIKRVLDLDVGLPLWRFIDSDEGILRHPATIWRTGISEDQKRPLYLYLKSTNSSLLSKYKLHDSFWPLKNFIGIHTWVQALIFRNSEYRWDDGKKSWQPMKDSSCDYLNFIAQIFYAHITDNKNWLVRRAMKLITADDAMIKIHHYYLEGADAEPNAEWLVSMYNDAIRKVWAV